MSIEIQVTHLPRIKKRKWTKSLLKVITAIFLIVNIIGLFIGNILYKKFIDLPTSKGVNQYDLFKDTFNEQKYNKYEKRDISLESKHGYTLYGTYIMSPKPSNKTIILVHGLNGSRWSALKYADMYLNKDFNVIVYDARAHGQSGGKSTSFGYYEKDDLDDWVEYAWSINKYGIIGVHGESIGAVTALLYSETYMDKKRVKFYVVDSAFSDLETLIKLNVEKQYGITNTFVIKSMLFYTNIINLYKSHYIFSKVSPIKSINEVSTPILFIHGEKDNFIPSSMTKEMYKAKPGVKDTYISSQGGNGTSYNANPEVYKDKLYKFIDEALK